MRKFRGCLSATLLVFCALIFAAPLVAQTQPRPPEAAAPPAGTLANGQLAQPQQLAVQPPFVLTQQQQSELDHLLDEWEKNSNAIKQFKCSFTRWEYDP